MIKNLFLGAGTVHAIEPVLPTGLVDQLRFCAEAMVSSSGHSVCTIAMGKASLRIEQLERELAEAQKYANRYSWAICNPTLFVIFCNGFGVIDEEIDTAISEVKA